MSWTQNLPAKILVHCGLLAILFPIACPPNLFADQPHNWKLVTKDAGWQARDFQGELVFNDRLWVFGGWFDSYSAPSRDVWSSPDGRHWRQETENAAWSARLWFSSFVYRDQMWVLGGWSKDSSTNHGDV